MPLLRLSLAAREMGVSPDTLRRRCVAREIEHTVQNGRYFIPAEAVQMKTSLSIIPVRARRAKRLTAAPKLEVTDMSRLPQGVYRRGKQGYLCADYKGRRFSSGTADLAEFKRLYKAWLIDQTAGPITDDAVSAVVEPWLTNRSVSQDAATIRDKRSVLADFCKLYGGMYVSQINGACIHRWIEVMSGRGCSGTTINKATSYLNDFLRYCQEVGYLGDDAPKARRVKAVRHRKEPFTHEQMVTLRLAVEADPDLKPFFYLAATTALRRGEIFSLTWADLDSQARTITVKPENDKAGREHVVDYPVALMRELEPLRGDGRIFRFNPYWYDKRFKALREACGCYRRGDGFHAIRHFCASALIESGRSLAEVQAQLGHRDVTTTARYVHVLEDGKRATGAVLGDLIGAGKVVKMGRKEG